MSNLSIRKAVRALRRGGVIAYPTEGVWGLGCDPFDPEAVATLLELKQREVDKGLILVAAAIEQFEPYLRVLTPAQRELLTCSWPGPQTWIVPHGSTLPGWITGYKPGVALRVSTHPVVVALCRCYGGAIVSTSANPAGRPPARNALKVHGYFGKKLDYVLHGKLGNQIGPTPIRDLINGSLLRGG